MQLLYFSFVIAIAAGQTLQEWEEDIASNQGNIQTIIDHIYGVGKHRFYDHLAEWTDTFGARVCGSQALENSIDYLKEEFKEAGFTNVSKESVTVPGWERGDEFAWMLEPRRQELAIFGLGGTIPTPADGLEADVMVVRSYEELENRKSEVSGKMVLFNHDWTEYNTQFRVNGAIEAAKHGAVACLIRSLASFSLYTPHTGGMDYNETIKKIPAAALTVEDADMFERMIKRGWNVRLHLHLEGTDKPNHTSHNLVAEIKGSEFPDEIVFFGGHLDSWDRANGVQDDGIGVIMAAQVLYIIKELQLTPRRTMRFIGWTCEENGLHGGEAYYNRHKDSDNMVLGMEADSALFKPLGVGLTGSGFSKYLMEQILQLLSAQGTTEVLDKGASADNRWWNTGRNVPVVRMAQDRFEKTETDRYFHYHHSMADHMNAVDADELDLSQIIWTTVAYVVANLDHPLPTDGEYPAPV